MTNVLPALVPERMRRQPWIWRLQSLLSNYLPLFLMAVLAAGTWWLVKNTPLLGEVADKPPARHEPDYRMSNFELQRISAEGKLQVLISGAELRHYPDDDTVEIDHVKLRAIAPDGSVATAEAKLALSNADASELQLRGDVVVRRLASAADTAALLEVRGEFLQVLANAELMRSHQPVSIRAPGASIQAQGFEYRHISGSLSFSGRTQARFESRKR